MYKHCETSDKFLSISKALFDENFIDNCINLHDCTVKEMHCKNGVLSLIFPDGIAITPNHPLNTFDKTVLTDKAQVDFHIIDDNLDGIEVTLFELQKAKNMFKNNTCRQIKHDDFIRLVNQGDIELFFNETFYGENSIVITSSVNGKTSRKYGGCVIVLRTSMVEYKWNELCPEKEW